MKKLSLLLSLLLLCMFCAAQKAEAALLTFELGLPDITSNSTGTYSYNAGTNLFTFTATADEITFDGTNKIHIDNGSYLARFYVDESGNFTSGFSGYDLVITGDIDVDGNKSYDYTGTLVAGEVNAFGWIVPATGKAWFNYTFDFQEGALSSYYESANAQGWGGDEATSEVSTFAGNFNTNFSGTKTKHNTAPLVPEPTSMLLLGMGILGLFGIGRKKVKA